MAAPDHKTRHTAKRIPQALLLVSVTLLAAASGMTGMARRAAFLGPAIGGIIAFDPAQMVSFETGLRLIAARDGQKNCVLDLDVMRRSGGSLVLEQRLAGPEHLYRAHWAGPGTSEAVTDCGSAADLLMSVKDVSLIAAAAGGFGAARSPGPPLGLPLGLPLGPLSP